MASEATDHKVPNPLGRGADGSKLPILQTWSPRHDLAVALHLSGKKNVDIARVLEWTPEHVSIVLRQPQAKAMVERAQRRMRETTQEAITERLLELSEKAVERLEETLEQTFILGSKSKHHQDNTSLKILQGTGFLAGKKDGEKEEATDKVTATLVERLTASLEKAAEARIKARDVVEAPYEVVEDEDDDSGE